MVSVWSAVAISWGIIPWVSFWLFTFSVKHLFISFAHFSGGFLFWFGFFVFVCLKAVIEQFASHSMVFCLHNPGLKWEDYSIWDGLGVKKLDLVWGECKRKTGTSFLVFTTEASVYLCQEYTCVRDTLLSVRSSACFFVPFLSVWQPWRQSGGVSIPHWHCLRNSNPLPPSLPYFSSTPVEPLPLWPWDCGLLHTLQAPFDVIHDLILNWNPRSFLSHTPLSLGISS